MGRKRRPNEPSSYVPAPEVPAEVSERLTVITAVLAGTMSMSEGASRLNMARNNFQALVHRTKQAMLTSLEPRPTGPKPRPEREAELETENQKLRQRAEKLEKQLHTMDRLLGVAGEVITGLRESENAPDRSRTTARSPHSSQSSTPPSGEDDEDPEPAALLAKVADVSERGLAARVLGVAPSTERRWRAHVGAGRPIRRRRGGHRQPPSPQAEAKVRSLVRELNGLAGAESLSHSVGGVSRRTAAAIKADELSAMERERRARCQTVHVLRPGVVRGFDAMYTHTSAGWRYSLIAADSCVPYRTSIQTATRYDSGHVARVLDDDFRTHGPPLVCRLDRAACQRTDEVDAVLAHHRVLRLHGPPHHPGYYGQLERQNREHRAWLDALDVLDPDALDAASASMRTRLNGLWRRRTLDWRTAEEVWMERQPVNDDRAQLHDEVLERAARLRGDGLDDDLAMRLAIEKALTIRGYLRVLERR